MVTRNQQQGTRALRNQENLLRQTAMTVSSDTRLKAKLLAGRRKGVEPARNTNLVYRIDSERLDYVENTSKTGEPFFAFVGVVNGNPMDGRRTHKGGYTVDAIIVPPVRSRDFGAALNQRNSDWKDVVHENAAKIQQSARFVAADAAYIDSRWVSPEDRRDILYVVASGFFGDNLCIDMLDMPMPVIEEQESEAQAEASAPVGEEDPSI